MQLRMPTGGVQKAAPASAIHASEVGNNRAILAGLPIGILSPKTCMQASKLVRNYICKIVFERRHIPLGVSAIHTNLLIVRGSRKPFRGRSSSSLDRLL
jgi:hypothetical protein